MRPQQQRPEASLAAPSSPSRVSLQKQLDTAELNFPQQPDCLLELPAPTEQRLRCFLAVNCPVPQERSFSDPPCKGSRGTAQECTRRS